MKKKYVILGSGVSGKSVYRFCQKHAIPAEILDETSLNQDATQASFDEIWNYNASHIVVSPGISPTRKLITSARAAGVVVTNDITLFLEVAKKPVIGITGSNGKSTTCHILQSMLTKQGISSLLGGNFGTPALDLLENDEPDYYILELSSFQLEVARYYQLRLGVLLNITEDHLDRHETFEAYRDAKLSIADHAEAMIVPKDDSDLCKAVKERAKELVLFDPHSVMIPEFANQPWYMQQNISAVLSILETLGIECPDQLPMLAGLPHRFEKVLTIQGITFINDSKGTNPGCVASALASLKYPVIVILGGQTKEADISPLAPAFTNKVIHAILIGEDAMRFEALCNKTHTPCTHASNMQQAVSIACCCAMKGDTVLLSPGGASFDWYSGGYAERGDDFCNWVYQQI